MLPENPSKLIRFAIEKLDIAIAGGFVFKANDWLVKRDGHYEGCLAGATMLSLGLIPEGNEELYPANCKKEYQDKLRALCMFADGQVNYGLSFLGIKTPAVGMSTNCDSVDEFKKDMLVLANYLELKGL